MLTHISRHLKNGRKKMRFAAALACMPFLALLLTGCANSSKPKAFPTPGAAVESVVTAIRVDNTDELKKILGPKADEAMSSGDPVADAHAREDFLALYDAHHEIVPGATDSSMILHVGQEDWPMPIPIVQDAKGWRFDTEAGLEEMLNRRIGFNELFAIETCRAIGDAQRDYLSMNPMGQTAPTYAAKFLSSPSALDGLYWSSEQSDALSPLGELVAEAIREGYEATGEGGPYNGYHYRILTAQGPYAAGGEMSYLEGDQLTKGFAIVAYPARHRNSGVMTFIMNHQGIVYECDLGANTDHLGASMKHFNPDPRWTMVEMTFGD